MISLTLRLSLVLSLAAPALAGPRTSAPELGGDPGKVPVKIDMSVASLNAPLQTMRTAAPLPTTLGDAALANIELPALEPVAGLVSTAKPPGNDTAGPLLGWRGPGANADFTAVKDGPAPGLDLQVGAGHEQFDRQTSKYSLSTSIPSVRRWLTDLWNGADRIPAWPGKTGDAVKIDGKTYVLERRLGEGNSAVVWKARERGNEVAVKFIHPEFKNIPLYGEEVLSLEALAHTRVPHAALLAKSADGLVIVKDYSSGDKGADVLARGDLSDKQRHGFAELAARLIEIGYTADIHPNNLLWEPWRGWWSLADGGGFAMGRPGKVISQILEGPARKAVSPVEFLSGLRGRLGPDSDAWRQVLEDAAAHPALGAHLRELEAYDRSLTPVPLLHLASAAKEAVLDDALISWGQLIKRLGYDPRAAPVKIKLHGDDPGKLNTSVREIYPRGEGGPAMVTKTAGFDIIRSELAVRRLLKRWFAAYFDTPASLGVAGGWESFMIMDRVQGSPSFVDTPLDLEKRVAFALFVHTFGLGDVNQGNVLSVIGEKGRARKVSLIDFEQAFSRHAPVNNRIPDERIVQEMPWMSQTKTNRIEDYLPAIKAWRAVFGTPQTQGQIAQILRESGFTDKEIPGLLAVFRANVGDLEWSIQNDVEFANFFVQRRAPR